MESSESLVPLIEAMRSGKGNADQARKLAVRIYNEANGASISESVSRDDPALWDVVRWFDMERDYFFLDEYNVARKTWGYQPIHGSIALKQNALTQLVCPVCRPVTGRHVIPLRVPPMSGQTRNKRLKRAFQAAIADRLGRRGSRPAFYNSRLCVRITFSVGAAFSTTDLDNLAKAALDGFKGVLFADDAQIDHLNLFRFSHDKGEDSLAVTITDSRLNDHEDVIYRGELLRFVDPQIDVTKFME